MAKMDRLCANCKHRNKNEGCGAQQIFYKGKHAHSYSERKHKMGAMIGTCYRIQRNSFSDELLIKELREKTREWQECLKYTPKFVLSAILNTWLTNAAAAAAAARRAGTASTVTAAAVAVAVVGLHRHAHRTVRLPDSSSCSTYTNHGRAHQSSQCKHGSIEGST